MPKAKIKSSLSNPHSQIIRVQVFRKSPHIHVLYGEYMGVIDIHTNKMIQGDLPDKALKIAQEWTSIHQQELLKMWETQDIKQLPPID